MADTNSTDAAPTPVPPVVDAGAGTQAPAGFVPQGDLEREQARARDFQARADRASAELAALKAATPAPKPEATTTADVGFDPVAFRNSLLADVASVNQLTQAVSTLRERFPHADPAIYERVTEFGNADALRLAVEDSHVRVAALIDGEKTRIEAALREEFAAKNGGGTPQSGAAGTSAGDPTVEQLSAMSVADFHAFDALNPGVAERVLRSAS